MSRFLKFLIIIAAVINLIFVFIFDGKIPSNLSLPFVKNAVEGEKETAEETETLPAETEETVEKETEFQTEEAAAEEPETGEPETEEVEEEEILPRCRIIAAGGSNVRSGPGTNFEIVTAYPYDTVFTLRGEPEIGWYPILAEDGTEGYIFENQIEIIDVNTAEENIPLTEERLQ